jgi:hypothetical protein
MEIHMQRRMMTRTIQSAGLICLLGGAMAFSACAGGSDPVNVVAELPKDHPVFMNSIRCARCHSLSPRATALRTPTGEDASPHGLWSATMMANSFRDPYWRAQVACEIASRPEYASEIQALCLTCHAPMEHHAGLLEGRVVDDVVALEVSHLAQDGVSCTVCHQAQPTAFGEPESFNGRLDIEPGKRIFGPYPNPAPGPMRRHTGYTPTHGPHVQDSALCGSCHTLHTRAHGVPGAPSFPEQTPYLEWRNSAYSDHDGETETSRSCQACHMTNFGSLRIARNPGGRDFNIAIRDDVRGHQFVGGNAFMLDLMDANREALGVVATPAAMERAAAATRATLRTHTATIDVKNIRRDGAHLLFDVVVTNLTGHKFPTGYPARRAWLETSVQCGRSMVFVSGGVDDRGRLRDVAAPLGRPHVDLVESPAQVPVFELVAHDLEGRPTTLLSSMVERVKDNRLLPAGWRHDGPFAADTAPVGIDGDADFAAGSDVVHFRVPLGSTDAADATVTVWMRYQPVPPAWVEPMRSVGAPETIRFLRMYDAASPRPETIAVCVASE